MSTSASNCTDTQVCVAPNTTVTYCYKATNNDTVTYTVDSLADSVLGDLTSLLPGTPPGTFPFRGDPFFDMVTAVSNHVITFDTVNVATWTVSGGG
ncbi:MAG TPA: hypothetical protein VN812_09260, partial [Candidatus Acidoferrales bacterium]|nr:hypothetical protein [Candidatus Acidoferrales bacterium]